MGVKESWVYPRNGGEPYRKGERTETTESTSYLIMPDLPDFVSSVDGKRYSGRAGLREHNKRHDVVLVEDLKGLPPRLVNSDIRSKQEKQADAAMRKQHIINQVNRYVR